MDGEGLIDDIQAAPPKTLADDGPESETRSKNARLSRKRTKTGCLTCRKRRIKCSEERPKCGNCIKSKRQCEGYNQRVIFKDPLGTYPVPSSTVQRNPPFNIHTALGGPSTSLQSEYRSLEHTSQVPPQKPVSNRDSSSLDSALAGSASLVSFADEANKPDNLRVKEFLPDGDTSYGRILNVGSRSNPPPDMPYDTTGSSYLPSAAESPKEQTLITPHSRYDSSSRPMHKSELGASQPDHSHDSGQPNGASCASEPPFQEFVYHSDIRSAASAILTQSYQWNADWLAYYPKQNLTPIQLDPDLDTRAIAETRDDASHWNSEHCVLEESSTAMRISHGSSPQDEEERERQKWFMRNDSLSTATACQDPILFETESPDIDDQLTKGAHSPDGYAFDLSDDEMGLYESEQDSPAEFSKAQEDHLMNNDLGIVVALHASQDMQEQRLRTYHSFLDGPNVLTSYHPSARSSPLRDSTTARIFYHYVNVTGPSISLYERHPANPSLMFQGRPVPRSQQHIWAYTMPTLALNNQALLHAMLAIGSLHIAFLQDGPKMPSLKHYHIAIRQLAKCVRLPVRRGQSAILAATLLLGWYELMSGEHQKWSSHLLGATILLKEIDFAGMTKFLKNRKTQQRQARFGNLYHHEMALGRFGSHLEEQADISKAPKNDDVNEGLVGMIVGRRLRYDEYGQVLDDFNASSDQQKVYTQREIETYETQRDLFWWYCKQDAFQSILSGNRLFLQYDWWSHCPPRAAIGKRDAPYGTFDHLILLLGRLTEFAAKDLKRKRRTMQANGGQWQPPSVASGSAGPTSQNASRQSGPPQIPSFAGMMPGTEGKAKLPRGFSPPREDSPISEDDNRSLENWTTEAEEEWHEIRTAFSILEENFGPDFQPLGPEHCQPIESPFGLALQYRTYSIAGVWLIYYMGLILCHRYHPTMPPAATIAAGIAARQTDFYANEVGRISAGIAPHASQVTQVSTGVGAGLIECTIGLFIAGVQYQNPAQRSWLVQRCFDIIRLTGWQTAEAVAMGCETAWTKTAQMGRGPPYTRVTEKKIDQEVWNSTRRRTNSFSLGGRDPEKVFIARTDRVHYALGLLGVEQSLENLDFDDDKKELIG